MYARRRTLLSAPGDRLRPTLRPWEPPVSYSTYSDKPLTCRDCSSPFVFTEGEQEFFAQKGFTNEPTRCPECRSARKSQQRGSTSYDSDRGYSSGGYDRGPREMFSATCSSC